VLTDAGENLINYLYYHCMVSMVESVDKGRHEISMICPYTFVIDRYKYVAFVRVRSQSNSKRREAINSHCTGNYHFASKTGTTKMEFSQLTIILGAAVLLAIGGNGT
jgi:hypothetical protein